MLIDELRDRYRTNLTKTCALFGMSRSLYRYRSIARDSSVLLMLTCVKHGDPGANGYILEHADVRAQATDSRILAGCASAKTLAFGFVAIRPSSLSAHAWSIALLCPAYSALL
ncbi:hypothetical protein G3N64_03380 [Burkholderia sp. Ac-20344]|nr:hypothetical protein [Burkholderia sp. Ac-20344]